MKQVFQYLIKRKSITKYFENDTISYKSQGQNIYYGNFYNDVCFLTPLDASECQDCASMYIQLNDNPLNFSQNIFGLDIILDYENNDTSFDDEGPNITFFTQDKRKLEDDDLVFENQDVIVEVEDLSGINLMDGLGHNIRYWFNNQESQIILDSQDFLYTSNCDSIYVGQFEVKLENLNYGLNTLNVEIWDNFNNKSTKSIDLNLESNSFKAFDVFNFPNPFKEKTFFTFKTSTYPVNINITVFDLSGKKIKSFNNYECMTSFCSIEWDGKDKFGNKINNGTYLYSLNISNSTNSYKNIYKLSKIKMKYILASKSPRRSEILRKAGFKFKVIPSNVDESKISTNLLPKDYCVELAKLKSYDIAYK